MADAGDCDDCSLPPPEISSEEYCLPSLPPTSSDDEDLPDLPPASDEEQPSLGLRMPSDDAAREVRPLIRSADSAPVADVSIRLSARPRGRGRGRGAGRPKAGIRLSRQPAIGAPAAAHGSDLALVEASWPGESLPPVEEGAIASWLPPADAPQGYKASARIAHSKQGWGLPETMDGFAVTEHGLACIGAAVMAQRERPAGSNPEVKSLQQFLLEEATSLASVETTAAVTGVKTWKITSIVKRLASAMCPMGRMRWNKIEEQLVAAHPPCPAGPLHRKCRLR